MYKIGELSKLCRIPVKTLRYYDSEGLLPPDEIDRFSGYRYYSASKLSDCYKILALKELGFSLDEIRQQLQADTQEELLALINSKEAELAAKRDTVTSQLKQLDTLKQILAKGENHMYHIVIQNSGTVRVAARRSLYASKKEAEAELKKLKETLPQNICGSRSILIDYETEYRETDLDLAACVEITGPLPKGCGYEEKTLELSGDTATLACKSGEFDSAYSALLGHLYENNYQLVGASYEIYYDDGTVELKIPVAKKVRCNDALPADEPFENDPEAVGKWKLIDIVPSREQFVYGSPKLSHIEKNAFEELYFLENGEAYWVVEGWTKGKLFRSAEFPERHKVEEKYTIESTDKHTLLFLETQRRYADGTMDAVPVLWVYEKLSGDSFQAKDIKIRDNTDYPFVPDPAVLGKWKVFDFYNREIEGFDPSVQRWDRDGLFLLSVEFLENGKCIYTTKNGSSELAWTKGLVLNHRSETAPAYQIKKIDGIDYLILEWKSGDYSFGGLLRWYIFTRA